MEHRLPCLVFPAKQKTKKPTSVTLKLEIKTSLLSTVVVVFLPCRNTYTCTVQGLADKGHFRLLSGLCNVFFIEDIFLIALYFVVSEARASAASEIVSVPAILPAL